MYLHIGSEISIPFKKIIAIMDLATIQLAGPTKELLELAQKEERLFTVAEDNKHKSVIITDTLCYLSTISVTTLTQRIKNFKL